MSTPFSNNRSAKISDLIGMTQSVSDLQSHRVKIRYTESTTVQQGNYMRITFPKRGDSFLDCRSIKMRFNLNIASTDDQCCVAGPDVRCLWNRLRVLSGSTVLADISEASTAFALESLVEVSTMDSDFSRYLAGQQPVADRVLYKNGREYIVDICPKGTILNCEALLPLSAFGDLHFEIWLEKPERALYSIDDDTSATFSLSNIELLANYITSPSISQYFAQNGLKFSTVDISHRYNPMLSQESLIRCSSSHQSVSSIVNMIRKVSQIDSIGTPGKFEVFDSGENRADFNVLVNNTLFFEENVNSVEQTWKFLTSIFPKAEFSTFFNENYLTTGNILPLWLNAAPSEFSQLITSGIKTSAINSDITFRVKRKLPVTEPLRADSFIRADAVVYLPSRGSDLKVNF